MAYSYENASLHSLFTAQNQRLSLPNKLLALQDQATAAHSTLGDLLAQIAAAQTFPLDHAQWLLDPQQADQGVTFTKKGTLAFWFPAYATSPNNYTGYLLLPWTQALTGTTFSATVQVVTFPAGTIPVRLVHCTLQWGMHVRGQGVYLLSDEHAL